MVNNSAFVFIKPHAVTDATIQLVKKKLNEFGLEITGEGVKAAKEIDEKQLIDTHYYAIASKATLLKPSELNVPANKFKEKFGLEWKDALASGKVYNAKDACAKFGYTADELNSLWAQTKKNNKLIKFGGGFYCGEVQEGVYVFNGFFMTMRSAYVAENASIYWFTVTWNEEEISWEDFRGKVLGPTDPSTAPTDSIRGTIYSTWKSLGLPAEPDTGNNGVHASASPFEAFAERKNWLGADMSSDEFGKMLLKAGLDAATIEKFCLDPAVPDPAAGGKEGSLWDQLEDTNSSDCLRLCVLFNLVTKIPSSTPSPSPAPAPTPEPKAAKTPMTATFIALCIGAAGGFLLAKTCLKKL